MGEYACELVALTRAPLECGSVEDWQLPLAPRAPLEASTQQVYIFVCVFASTCSAFLAQQSSVAIWCPAAEKSFFYVILSRGGEAAVAGQWRAEEGLGWWRVVQSNLMREGCTCTSLVLEYLRARRVLPTLRVACEFVLLLALVV